MSVNQFQLVPKAEVASIGKLSIIASIVGISAAPMLYGLGAIDTSSALILVAVMAISLPVSLFSVRAWNTGSLELNECGFVVKTFGSADRYLWTDVADVGITFDDQRASRAATAVVTVKLRRLRRYFPFGGSGTANMGLPVPASGTLVLKLERATEFVELARLALSDMSST